MALFAISDLHLSRAKQKTMDRFGAEWVGHVAKISEAWKRSVGEKDSVLLPGDLSWALKWDEFIPDLDFLAGLPGQKIISRGNHDYYWQSKTKMDRELPQGIIALERSFASCEGYNVVAVKGWLTPGCPEYVCSSDEKYFLRERGRLEQTLAEASKEDLPIIVLMHFPAFAPAGDIGFSDILEQYQVKLCLYGHLHGVRSETHPSGIIRGVRYQLVAADYLHFSPLRVLLKSS